VFTHGEKADVRMRPVRVLHRLSRPRTSGRYLPEIDGLRGLSIVMVLLFHTCVAIHIAKGAVTVPDSLFGAATSVSSAGIVGRLLRAGGGGVEMFFAISGFVLAIPFLDARFGARARRVSVVGFYRRRLTRLEPPYLIALVLWAGVAAMLGAGPSAGSQCICSQVPRTPISFGMAARIPSSALRGHLRSRSSSISWCL